MSTQNTAPAPSTARRPKLRLDRPASSSTASLPDVPPRALHGQLHHQPLDGAGEPDRHRPGRAPVAGRCTTRTSRSATRSHLIDPIEGLPDMVYTANGGFLIDGVAYGAKFRFQERVPRRARRSWSGSARHGFDVAEPVEVNEGEGDFLLVGDTILAGTGFRSTGDSHRELGDVFGKEVVSLTLVDPRFYHLDTAHLGARPGGGRRDGVERANIAYLPGAFDDAEPGDPRRALPRRHPRRRTKTAPSSASTRPATASTSSSPHARRASRRSFASAATTRCSSTSPSSCSAAAASSAARSSCAGRDHDDPRSLDADATSAIIAAEAEHVAHNYHPLPVVISRGEGAWVTDVEGKRYLDLLSAYSALNFGHGHPAIVAAAQEQLGPPHAHEPGVPQRPARRVRRGARASSAARTSCCR